MTHRDATARPKRLIICLDGTWNNAAKLEDRDDGDKVYKPTNVLKLSRAVKSLDDVTAVLSLRGQPIDGESVAIAGKTYAFQEELTDVDGNVLIGDSTQRSLENLRMAVNRKGQSQNRYAESMVQHALVEARAVRGNRFSIEVAVRSEAATGDDALRDRDPFAVSARLKYGSWVDKSAWAEGYRDLGLDPALGTPQTIYYQIGVGGLRKYPGVSNAAHRFVDKSLGGAAGAGFEANIEEAYSFLALNYAPGDEIYAFGFSRGAASARGLCHFIDWMGGLLPSKDAYWIPRYFDGFLAGRDYGAVKKRIREGSIEKLIARGEDRESAERNVEKIMGEVVGARVRFLGVWDTVMSLGENRGRVHVSPAPPAIVDHARQALAIDERRPDFRPRIWQQKAGDNAEQTLQQRWFAGVHSNIGGGYVHDGLANLALQWLVGEARALGLGLESEQIGRYRGYAQDQLYDSRKLVWKVIQAGTLRWNKGVRRLTVSVEAGLHFHSSVFERLASSPDRPDGPKHEKLVPYRPQNLLSYLAAQSDLDDFLATVPGLPEGFTLPQEVLEAIRKAKKQKGAS